MQFLLWGLGSMYAYGCVKHWTNIWTVDLSSFDHVTQQSLGYHLYHLQIYLRNMAIIYCNVRLRGGMNCVIPTFQLVKPSNLDSIYIVCCLNINMFIYIHMHISTAYLQFIFTFISILPFIV